MTLYMQSIAISMAQQVDYFGEVREKLVKQVGPAAAQHHLAKSIFVVVMGSNDLFAYFSNNSDKYAMKGSPQQYVDEMVSALHGFLEILHHLGARKLVITAVGPLGCTPLRRRLNDTEECSDKVNSLVKKYNKHLRSMLQQLKSDFNDINYSYFDTYKVFLDLIQTPTNYGFTYFKAACCGSGKLNAESFCVALFNATLCPNRKDHIFWDAVHPTEAADHVLVDMIYNGSQPIAFPINLKQLIAI
jgi:phospholipase/lecithinase/hemolysin